MATYKRKEDFFSTEAGIEMIKILRMMNLDDSYNTQAGYSSNTELYPDNVIPFVENHIEYVKSHPLVNPEHYLSNLRLITRIR